jgi:hypothetical protein
MLEGSVVTAPQATLTTPEDALVAYNLGMSITDQRGLCVPVDSLAIGL